MNGHIHPLSPPPYVLLDPQKGASQRSSHKERYSHSGALHSSFVFPGKGALPEAPSMQPLERAIPHSESPFIQLSKSPVDEPSSRFPKSGAPMKRDAPSPEPFLNILRGPQQRSPPPGSPKNGAPIERDAPSVEPPFNYLSEFPVNRHIRPLSPLSLRVPGEQTYPSSEPSSLGPSGSPKNAPEQKMLPFRSSPFLYLFITV